MKIEEVPLSVLVERIGKEKVDEIIHASSLIDKDKKIETLWEWLIAYCDLLGIKIYIVTTALGNFLSISVIYNKSADLISPAFKIINKALKGYPTISLINNPYF